jgi:hypothetical protein
MRQLLRVLGARVRNSKRADCPLCKGRLQDAMGAVRTMIRESELAKVIQVGCKSRFPRGERRECR